MARLSAAAVRDFTVPAADLTPSPHGAQREDAIIASYLPGWTREMSDAAYAAFLPGVHIVHEGNSRGRGRTLVDGHRPNPSRGAGGDFLSLKDHGIRSDGTVATSTELFLGTRETLVHALAAVRANYRARKAFPVVVTHSTGEGQIVEWCVRDFGHMLAHVENREAWPLWHGVPIKPEDDRPRGRGGSPASIWVKLLRREQQGLLPNGRPKYVYVPDEHGTYVALVSSFSQKSGAVFRSGSMQEFAADVDAATVLR